MINTPYSQEVQFHNLNPKDCIVEIGPRDGEHLIRLEDVIAKIEEPDELSMVMIGGANYFTYQVFDMKAITEAGQVLGKVGFDLARCREISA